MTDHLAVLDKGRKAVLAIPHAAFKLWMCYWMNEDEQRESFVAQPEIRVQTGLSITSIVNWTQWLVRHGWIVPTGGTAYDKLLALGRIPSDNSKQVKVYRVEDPTTTKSVVEAPLQNLKGDTTTKSVNKVSGSGFGSSSVSSSPSRSCSEGSSSCSSDSGEVESRPSTPTANQEPKIVEPKPTPATGKGKNYPAGFDSWSNKDRLNWIEAQKANGTGYASSPNGDSSIEQETPETENQNPMTPAEVMARWSGDDIWDARGRVRDNEAGRAWTASQALDPANV